jgi:hypothetical protein
MEVFYEDLARSNTVAHLSQLQLWVLRCRIWVSVLSHRRFSHRRSVLRLLYRTMHGLLGIPVPVCLSVFDLSVYHFFYRFDWLANPIACASFPRLTLPLL